MAPTSMIGSRRERKPRQKIPIYRYQSGRPGNASFPSKRTEKGGRREEERDPALHVDPDVKKGSTVASGDARDEKSGRRRQRLPSPCDGGEQIQVLRRGIKKSKGPEETRFEPSWEASWGGKGLFYFSRGSTPTRVEGGGG